MFQMAAQKLYIIFMYYWGWSRRILRTGDVQLVGIHQRGVRSRAHGGSLMYRLCVGGQKCDRNTKRNKHFCIRSHQTVREMLTDLLLFTAAREPATNPPAALSAENTTCVKSTKITGLCENAKITMFNNCAL